MIQARATVLPSVEKEVGKSRLYVSGVRVNLRLEGNWHAIYCLLLKAETTRKEERGSFGPAELKQFESQASTQTLILIGGLTYF